MCCPHGHAFVENPDYDFYDYEDYSTPAYHCKKNEGELDYNPVLWDHNDQQFLETWEKNKNFIIVAPKLHKENKTVGIGFVCSEDEGKKNITSAPIDLGTFRILINGKLEGKNILHKGINKKETKRWRSKDYCVVFAENSIHVENSCSSVSASPTVNTTNFDFTYMICEEDQRLSWCDKFKSTYHPILLSISVIFLLITLIVYICEDSFWTNPLFSKITIAFISNLTIAFIIRVDSDVKNAANTGNDRLGTTICILSGYMLMYFFLAFSFWINTMSFNVWMKFAVMSIQANTRTTKEKENKKFLKYAIYAQGMPLLIVAITAIIDGTATRGCPEDLIHYPNMGRYGCFLGAVVTAEHQSFFGRPEFIYFYVFLLILQIFNTFFLGHTLWFLNEGWKNQKTLITETGR